MKLGRQSVIMEIISERDIETQNQLLEALAERGVKSTQATLHATSGICVLSKSLDRKETTDMLRRQSRRRRIWIRDSKRFSRKASFPMILRRTFW